MDKEAFYYFKNNNLKLIYETATNEWISELFDFPLISFLKKINKKKAEKWHYKLMKLRFLLKHKPIIPNLEYVVTTKCTLNCKHCNTFIPTLNETNSHVNLENFEQFKKDIDAILKSVDYIQVLGFVGGEPLISSELYKMVEYAVKQKRIHNIFIATNCTILPSEKLLKTCKNKKVAFQISDYRNVKNITSGVTVKYDEFKAMLVENKVKFNNFQEKREALNWFSMPKCYKDKRNPDAMKSLYDGCFGRYCNMLAEGILLQCTVSVHMYRAKERTAEIENDVVNIRETKPTKELTEELINFYARPYSEFCNWCHWENIQRGLPCGEQVCQ